MSVVKSLKKNVYFYIIYTRVRDWFRLKLWSDHEFKVKMFKKNHGKMPNLDNPVTFSEKLLWSSENYRDVRFIRYADKYLVRDYVKNIIGEDFLIPIYDVIDSVKGFDISKYPSRFVLNATHGSNMVMLCNDKTKFDINKAKKNIKSWLRRNYYERLREWNYNYIKPRILVMKHIGSEDGTPPVDYKFFCFNGKPFIVALDIDRFGHETKRNIYDMDWNNIEGVFLTRPQDYSKDYKKPENFELMKQIVVKLASGFEHVRVDLYNVGGKIYFGELTFLHSAAGVIGRIEPYEFNEKMGSLFKLPNRNVDDWSYEGE